MERIKTHERPSADLRSHYVVIGIDEDKRYEQYILTSLEEGLAQLNDPSSKRYTHDEVWEILENEFDKN